MKTISDYFDKIYCVNLETRPDRWQQVTKELDKFNIKNVKRYNAVDGSKLFIVNHKLLKGEIGILKTHIELIKMAKEQNFKNILIMEDDVYFNEDLVNLEKYMEQLPEYWDMLYFGVNYQQNTPLNLIKPNIAKIGYGFGLQCVAINHTMYDKILKDLPKMEYQVDVVYANYMKHNKIYAFYPNLALQVEGFSDIQQQNVNYDRFFKNF